MSDAHARRFIETLHRLEEQNDLDAMVALYTDEAELSNPVDTTPHRGQDGARRFWEMYRTSFREIHSEFRNVAASENVAFMEWSSRGRAADGSPVEYDGVTVVEFQGDKVQRFRAYFDPASVQVHAGAG